MDDFFCILECKKSSSRIECFICLLDGCGFCKVVIKDEASEKVKEHLQNVHFLDEQKKIKQFSVVLVRKGPKNEGKAMSTSSNG